MNTLVAQIRDLFASMTPGARITSGLLLVVAVVSVAFLFQNSVAGPDAFLFGGERFSQSEINRMTAAMAEGGLSGWSIDSNRISVPRAIEQDAIAAIASSGALPDNFADFMDKALADGGAMEGRHKFELRTKTARENQLSLIISKFPWVESAHVMLDIQERRGFNRKNDASASVFITPRLGEGLDKVRARNIKQLIAGALASLSIDNVNITSGGSDAETNGEPWFDDPFLQAREELQKAYKTRIMRGLDYIPGVRVEVSADLENMTARRVTETAPLEGKVVRSETESEKEDSSVSDGGGQPGLPAQGPGRNGLSEALARENRTNVTRESSVEESIVGNSVKQEEYLGFKPKELYASIAIPREYVIGIWEQEHPDGKAADITDTEMQTMENSLKIDVERWVQNILPRLSLGEDEYRQVEVVYYDSLQRPAPPEPTFTEYATAWAGRYWGSLSMIGLAAVSLLMLRSAIHPGTVKPGDSEAGTLQLELGTNTSIEEEDVQADKQERPKLRIKKSESLKEDLSEMVREDPDAAASILRSWINNAG